MKHPLAIFRPDLALVWAVLATVSAAASTVVYLLYAHDQDWAPHFIQLYATMGMISGWLNSLIYFLAPRSIFLQTRRAALGFFLLALVAASLIYTKIFHQPVTTPRLLFLMASFVPVLYANAFGIEFYEGNYPWPYKRVVVLNSFFFLAALGAFFTFRTEEALYLATFGVGAVFLALWSIDRWNPIDVPKEKKRSIRPWLNPSVPVLERTLWDQWVMLRLDITSWSFPIYAMSRVITFVGNVSYSYLQGTNSRAHASLKRKDSQFIWLVLLVSAPIAAAAVKYVWCAFLLGQVLAWTLTSLLTSEYNSTGKSYGRYLLLWIVDFGLRLTGVLVAQDINDYLPFLIFSGSAGLIVCLLIWKKRFSSSSPEKANTKFHSADSLNIR